ncbi:hypothetical protein WJX82_004459 [Trebouxia sp. C0006]
MGSPARAVSFLTDLTSWHADTFRPDSTGDFDTTALHGLRITSSTSGRMMCDFPVDKRVQNRFGTLHGGCIATLVDDVSSGAIVSVAPHAGVSVHMSMNYLSPTPGGQDCEVDAHVTKAGRTLAFADVEIRNKRTGKVTARGTHIKFIPPMPDPTASSSNIKMPPGAPKAAATPEAAEDFITDMINDVREGFQADATRNFEATALCGLRDITATRGQVVCVLPVNQRVQNRYNTLHGGCIATLVDVIGSAAIMTMNEHSGVSLQISIDYLSELPGGEECEATATVSHLGKSTATATVDLRVKRTGRLAARGTHVKFLAGGLPHVRSRL